MWELQRDVSTVVVADELNSCSHVPIIFRGHDRTLAVRHALCCPHRINQTGFLALADGRRMHNGIRNFRTDSSFATQPD